ncbi:PDZ domain-containing protein [Streptomyces nogalater]
MISGTARVSVLLTVSAAMLFGGVIPATASAAPPTRTMLAVQSLPPQQNVPTLDAGGPAQTVTHPGDGQLHSGPSPVSIRAPPYTRITAVNLNCYGQSCPVNITADGKSATGQFPSSIWRFDRPLTVDVAADANAPLQGGTFSGTFTLEGVTQPLTVNIRPGVQGVVAGRLRNTNPPGGGVRVFSVDPGSSTGASGLQSGDVITKVAGVPTPTVNDLDNVLAASGPVPPTP